jgi:hypothetical protein
VYAEPHGHVGRQTNEKHPSHVKVIDDRLSMMETHELIPLDIRSGDTPGVDEVLSAVEDGTMEPELDPGDEPEWRDAVASPEREYWIAGGKEELKSLEDLKVFVLVPRAEVPRGQPWGQCPLKGKLVCKRKRDQGGGGTKI